MCWSRYDTADVSKTFYFKSAFGLLQKQLMFRRIWDLKNNSFVSRVQK